MRGGPDLSSAAHWKSSADDRRGGWATVSAFISAASACTGHMLSHCIHTAVLWVSSWFTADSVHGALPLCNPSRRAWRTALTYIGAIAALCTSCMDCTVSRGVCKSGQHGQRNLSAGRSFGGQQLKSRTSSMAGAGVNGSRVNLCPPPNTRVACSCSPREMCCSASRLVQGTVEPGYRAADGAAR